MKAKFYFIIVTIISLILLTSLSSCSSDPEPTKQVFVNPVHKTFYEQTTDTVVTAAVSVQVKKGMTLAGLAQECTGNWHGWQTIYDMNYNLLKNRLEYKIINGKSVPWVWIYPEEILDLPSNYAKCPKSKYFFNIKNGTSFRKKYVKTKEKLYTIDSERKEGGIPLLIDENDNEAATPPATANHTPFWSTGFGHFLANILYFLLWLAILMLLLLLIYWLYNQFQNMSSGGNTGGGGTGTGGGDDNEEDPCACDNTTTRMQQIPAILEGMGNAAGEFGHSSFSMRDGDFELKLKTSKSPKQRMTDEDVRKIVNEVLGDYYTDNTILMILERLPEFQSREELVDYLNRKFPIEDDNAENSDGAGNEPTTE